MVRLLGALLGLALLPGGAPSPRPAPEDPELAARVDRYLAPLVAAGAVSGVLQIARGDEIVLVRCHGMANFELGVPNTPETRFCIASITKEMTFAATLRLAEERKLRLDDKLELFVDDFPRGDAITVLQLLNHRAGIPHRVTDDGDEAQPQSAADMVELARRSPLLAAPDGASHYSSAGYSVLARVLEVADGRPFRDLLRVRVFEPAGMTATVDPGARELVAQRASSYVPGRSGVLLTIPKDSSFLVGAGSVWSTARDLHALCVAIRGGRLGESVRQSMEAGHGYHWTGATSGYRAWLDRDEKSGMEVVFTGNLMTGALELLKRDLPRVANGEEVAPPEIPRPALVEVDAGKLRRFEGRYESSPGTRWNVRLADGVLFAGDRPLLAESESSFFSPCDWGHVAATFTPAGAVDRLDWRYPGGQLSCRRIDEESSR